jgi:hypothetical protein
MRRICLSLICTHCFSADKEKDYFFDKKKVLLLFHARISRSGKGRVTDFSATRVRVEGVGSPRVEKGSRKRPRPQGEFEKWKKVLFLVKMEFSLPNWLFQQSFVVFNNLNTSHIK